MLAPVTEQNFEALMDMELPPHQAQYLASNAYSIAQARYYPDFHPRATCCDGAPAGFLMHDAVANDEPGHYAIYRLMVDAPQQGRGIGRRAMELPLSALRAQPDARRNTICYKPGNEVGRRSHAAPGFAEVGIDDIGEMIAEIRVA